VRANAQSENSEMYVFCLKMRLLIVRASDAAGFSSSERVLAFCESIVHNIGDCCTRAHNLLNRSRAKVSK